MMSTLILTLARPKNARQVIKSLILTIKNPIYKKKKAWNTYKGFATCAFSFLYSQVNHSNVN